MKAIAELNSLLDIEVKSYLHTYLTIYLNNTGIPSDIFMYYNGTVDDAYQEANIASTAKATDFYLINYNIKNYQFSNINVNNINNKRVIKSDPYGLSVSVGEANLVDDELTLEIYSENQTKVEEFRDKINAHPTDPALNFGLSFDLPKKAKAFLKHYLKVKDATEGTTTNIKTWLETDSLLTSNVDGSNFTAEFRGHASYTLTLASMGNLEQLANDMYTIKATFKLKLTRPNIILIDYPIMINNKQLDIRLTGFKSKYITHISGIEDANILYHIGTKFNAYRGLPELNFVKSPPVDHFDIPADPDYIPVACILLQLDKTKPTKVGNLFDFTDFSFLTPYHKFLKDNVSTLFTGNLFKLTFYQDNTRLSGLNIDNSGNITSNTVLDMKPFYRVIIGIRKNYNTLPATIKTSLEETLKPHILDFVNNHKQDKSNLYTFDIPGTTTKLTYKVDPKGNVANSGNEVCYSNGTPMSAKQDEMYYAEWYKPSPDTMDNLVNDDPYKVSDKYFENEKPEVITGDWILYKGINFHKTIANRRNAPATAWTQHLDSIENKFKIKTSDLDIYVWDKTLAPTANPPFTVPTSNLLNAYEGYTLTDHKINRIADEPYIIINEHFYKLEEYTVFEPTNKEETGFKFLNDTTEVTPTKMSTFVKDGYIYLYFGPNKRIAKIKITPIDPTKVNDHKIAGLNDVLFQSAKLPRITITGLPVITTANPLEAGWYAVGYAGQHDYVFDPPEWNFLSPHFMIHKTSMNFKKVNEFMLSAMDKIGSGNSLLKDNSDLRFYCWDKGRTTVTPPPGVNIIGNLASSIEERELALLKPLEYLGVNNRIYKVTKKVVAPAPAGVRGHELFTLLRRDEKIFPNRSMLIITSEHNKLLVYVYASMNTKMLIIELESVPFYVAPIGQTALDKLKTLDTTSVLIEVEKEVNPLDSYIKPMYIEISSAKVVLSTGTKDNDNPPEPEQPELPDPNDDGQIWREYRTFAYVHRTSMNKNNDPVSEDMLDIMNYIHEQFWMDHAPERWYLFKQHYRKPMIDLNFDKNVAKSFKYNTFIADSKQWMIDHPEKIETTATTKRFTYLDFDYIIVNDYLYKRAKLEMFPPYSEGYNNFPGEDIRASLAKPNSLISINNDNMFIDTNLGFDEYRYLFSAETIDEDDKSRHKVTPQLLESLRVPSKKIKVIKLNLTGTEFEYGEKGLVDVHFGGALTDLELITLEKSDGVIWREKLAGRKYLHRGIMNENDTPKTPESTTAESDSVLPKVNDRHRNPLKWYMWKRKDITDFNIIPFIPETFTFDILTYVKSACVASNKIATGYYDILSKFHYITFPRKTDDKDVIYKLKYINCISTEYPHNPNTPAVTLERPFIKFTGVNQTGTTDPADSKKKGMISGYIGFGPQNLYIDFGFYALAADETHAKLADNNDDLKTLEEGGVTNVLKLTLNTHRSEILSAEMKTNAIPLSDQSAFAIKDVSLIEIRPNPNKWVPLYGGTLYGHRSEVNPLNNPATTIGGELVSNYDKVKNAILVNLKFYSWKTTSDEVATRIYSDYQDVFLRKTYDFDIYTAVKDSLPSGLNRSDNAFHVIKSESILNSIDYVSYYGYWYKIRDIRIKPRTQLYTMQNDPNTIFYCQDRPYIATETVNYNEHAGTLETLKLICHFGIDDHELMFSLIPISGTDTIGLQKVTDPTTRASDTKDLKVLIIGLDPTIEAKDFKAIANANRQVQVASEIIPNVSLESVKLITVPKKEEDTEIWRKYKEHVFVHRSIMNKNNTPETAEMQRLPSVLPKAFDNLDLYCWLESKHSMLGGQTDFVFNGNWSELTYSALPTQIVDGPHEEVTLDGITYKTPKPGNNAYLKGVILNDYVYEVRKILYYPIGHPESERSSEFSIRPDVNSIRYSISKDSNDPTKEYIQLEIYCEIKWPMVIIQLYAIPSKTGNGYSKQDLVEGPGGATEEKYAIITTSSGLRDPIKTNFVGNNPLHTVDENAAELGWYKLINIEEFFKEADNIIWRPHEGNFFHRTIMNYNNDPVTPYMSWYAGLNPKPGPVIISAKPGGEGYYGYDQTITDRSEVPLMGDIPLLNDEITNSSFTDITFVYLNEVGYKVKTSALGPVRTANYQLHPNTTAVVVSSTGQETLTLAVFSPKLNRDIIFTCEIALESKLDTYRNYKNLYAHGIRGYALQLSVDDSVRYFVKQDISGGFEDIIPGTYQLTSYVKRELKDSRDDWVQLTGYKNDKIWVSKYGCVPTVAEPNDLESLITANNYDPKLYSVDKLFVYNDEEMHKVPTHKPIPAAISDVFTKEFPPVLARMVSDGVGYMLLDNSAYKIKVAKSIDIWRDDNSVISSLMVDPTKPNIKVAPGIQCLVVDENVNSNRIFLYVHYLSPIWALNVEYVKEVDRTDKIALRDFFFKIGSSKPLLYMDVNNNIGKHVGTEKFKPGLFNLADGKVLTLKDAGGIRYVYDKGMQVDFENYKIYHPLVGGLEITDPSYPKDIIPTVKRGEKDLPYFELSPYSVVIAGAKDKVTRVTLTVKDDQDNVVYTYDQVPTTDIHGKVYAIKPTVEEILAMFKDGNPIQSKTFTITGKVKGTIKEAKILETKFTFDFQVGKPVFRVDRVNINKPRVWTDGVNGANGNNKFFELEYVTYHIVKYDSNSGSYKTVLFVKTQDFYNYTELSPKTPLEEGIKYTLQGVLKYKYLDPINIPPVFFIKNKAKIKTPTITLYRIDRVNDKRLDLNLYTSGMEITDAGEVRYKFVTTKWRIKEKDSGTVIYEADIDQLGAIATFKGFNSNPIPTNRDNLNLKYNTKYIVEAALVADPILESEYGSLEVDTGDPRTPIVHALPITASKDFDEAANKKEIVASIDSTQFVVDYQVDQTHTSTTWELTDGTNVLKTYTKTEAYKDTVRFRSGQDGVPELIHTKAYYVTAIVYSGDYASTKTVAYVPPLPDPYKVPFRDDYKKPTIEILSSTATTITVRINHPGEGPYDYWTFIINGNGVGENGNPGARTIKSTDGPVYTFTDLIPDNDYLITGNVYFKAGVTKGGTAFGATYTYNADYATGTTTHQEVIDRHITKLTEYPATPAYARMSWYGVDAQGFGSVEHTYFELHLGDENGQVLQKVPNDSPSALAWAWGNIDLPEYDHDYTLAAWLEYKNNGKSENRARSHKIYKKFRSGKLTFELIDSGIRGDAYTTIPVTDPIAIDFINKTYHGERLIHPGSVLYKCGIIIEEKWWKYVADIHWELKNAADPDWQPTEWLQSPATGSGSLKEQIVGYCPWGSYLDKENKAHNQNCNVRCVVTLTNGVQKAFQIW